MRKGGVFPGRQFKLDEEDEDEDGDDTTALEKKIYGAHMPDAALKVCLKELKRCMFLWWRLCPHHILLHSLPLFLQTSFLFIRRLKKMPQSMPEYALTRNYLDLMVELPWSKSSKGK